MVLGESTLEYLAPSVNTPLDFLLQDKPPKTLIIVKPQTKSCDVLANFSATKKI